MGTAVRASAPGSTMLFGEHAVLDGHPAVVAAINHRITVSWTPRADGVVTLYSDLGEETLPGDALPADGGTGPLRFLLAALARCPAAASGGTLRIEQAFPPDVGFGSSAAVTAATLAALHPDADQATLLRLAVETIRAVQGRGSGADAAASVYGGISAYNANDLTCRRIADPLPISLGYCGYKTPTPEVIAQVDAHRTTDPDRVQRALAEMAAASTDAIAAFELRTPELLAAAALRAQEAYRTLGLSTPELEAIYDAFAVTPGCLGAKISGAGRGDCVLALGTDQATAPGFESLPVAIDERGVCVEDRTP